MNISNAEEKQTMWSFDLKPFDQISWLQTLCGIAVDTVHSLKIIVSGIALFLMSIHCTYQSFSWAHNILRIPTTFMHTYILIGLFYSSRSLSQLYLL